MQAHGTLIVVAAALDDAEGDSHVPACISNGGVLKAAKGAKASIAEAMQCLDIPGCPGASPILSDLFRAYSLAAVAVHALDGNPLIERGPIVRYPQTYALRAAAEVVNAAYNKCARLSLKAVSQKAAA